MRRIAFVLIFMGITQLVISQPQLNIPGLTVTNPAKTYVIVFGNEDYQTYSDKYTEDVTHAIYEAEMFCEMMKHIYNVPKFNVSFYPNAISTTMKVAVNKVSTLANKAGADGQIIIYYTGRFEADKYGIKNYLIPTDQAEASINQGIDLDYIYGKLALAKTNNIWVLIDACGKNKDRGESVIVDGGNPLKIHKPEYASKIKAFVAKSTDEILYDQMADIPVNEAPKPPPAGADNTPPDISLTSPDQSGNIVVLDERSVLITGTIKDNSGVYAVAVNGQESHMEKDGSFQARVVLAMGENYVLIEAIDVKGNIAQKAIILKREEPKEEVVEETPRKDEYPIKGKYYALIIGIADYEDPVISDLGEPVNDAQKLYDILTTKYLFETENIFFLKNPSRAEIITTLDMLEQNITYDDNLLVFYAGHGYWDSKVDKGYWFPTDAYHSSTANWLRNSTITGYISGINSRHTLVIADACFSGSIFRTRAAFDDAAPELKKLYELPSREAMTSGSLEEVPDKSVFIEYITKRLSSNEDQYITATQLFQVVKPAVVSNSTTIPQFGDIKNTGHEGGAFIFIKR